MNLRDFKLYFFGWPFLGAFLAFIAAGVLDTSKSISGIMIILGIIAGYVALIAFILGLLYLKGKGINADSDQDKPS